MTTNGWLFVAACVGIGALVLSSPYFSPPQKAVSGYGLSTTQDLAVQLGINDIEKAGWRDTGRHLEIIRREGHADAAPRQ